jgi:hypothetical protein
MDDPSPRVPDSIEPISAYRAWFYSIEGKTAQLHPISGPHTPSRNDVWEGAESNWVTASCAISGSPTHEVPAEGCTCGFYSLKELDLAKDLATPLHLMTMHRGGVGQVVLGRILLSGKVIEHDSGYRAERARVAELIPFVGTERSVMVLANRLGVEMDPAVEPSSREEILLGHAGILQPPLPIRGPKASSDPAGSPIAGVIAGLGLVAAFIMVLAGVVPPISLVIVSILHVGRSSDSMAKAYRDWRDWRGSGSNRPRFLPPVQPAR